MKKISFLLLGVSLLATSAVAAEAPAILEEITIRSQQDAPFEETLTIREVRESSARDIGEALLIVPGITIVRKGAIANDIVLRGMQRDNVNMLLDGVRLYGGCPSRMDPPSFHFDFAEVEQIEIIKGPYDLENPGSMGGMINAISKSPGQGLGFDANITYGSYELLQGSATASFGNDKLDALGGYAYKYSLPPRSGDGNRITDIYPANSPNRYKESKVDSRAYDINTFWVKGGLNLTSDSRTELGYSYQDASHVLYPYLFMDADYDRTHRLNWTTTVQDITPVLTESTLQLWWNKVDHLMHDEYRASSTPSARVTRDYMMQTDAETKVYGGKLKGDWAVGPGTLTTGVDYYYRNWDATNEAAVYTMMNPYTEQAMIPDVDIDNVGAFGKYSWPLAEQWNLTGGARLDYNQAKANSLDAARLAMLYDPYYAGKTFDNDTDFTEVSGNLQLSWQATEMIEIAGGLASGVRTPDPQELYIGLQRIPTMMMPGATNWIGNPDLDATRNNQIDIAVKLSGDGYYLNTSIFYSDLQDYIYLVDLPDPDGMGGLPAARTYQNIDATMYGGEIAGQVALPFDLYASGTLSYVRGENDDTNEDLAEIPPLQGQVGLRWDIDSYFVELTERFADKQDKVDDNLSEDKTSGWAVTDIKAGVNWAKWSLYGGINNLFDKFYYTHNSYQRDPFRTGVAVPEVGAFAYMNLAYHY